MIFIVEIGYFRSEVIWILFVVDGKHQIQEYFGYNVAVGIVGTENFSAVSFSLNTSR